MASRLFRVLSFVLKWGILIQGAYYVLVYVYIACSRISYPYELEWMEGGTLDHVRRVVAGEAIYVKPSIDFVPFIYTPLYYYVSALVVKVFGIGFTPLRIVSFISSLGCLAVIFLFVRRETRSNLAGFAGASLFAASYRIGGAWLDLARIDSLFLFFLLTSLYVLRSRESIRTSIVAAVLLALSFFTKQSALFMAIFMCLYTLLAFKKASKFAFPLTFAALVTGVTIAGDMASNGWFSYYIFRLPSQHDLTARYLLLFWTRDLLGPLGIACGLSLYYAIRLAMSGTKRNDAIFVWCVLFGMIMLSWLSRLHEGGHDDVLLPVYAMVAITFGLCLDFAFQDLVYTLKNPRESAGASLQDKTAVALLVLILAFLQFPPLVYFPSTLIPTRADREAGGRIVEKIRAIDGDVFVPSHGYLAVLAGKRSFAHDCAISDVLRGKNAAISAELNDSVAQAFEARQFQAVILDSKDIMYMDEIRNNYERASSLWENQSIFMPVTGWRTRPDDIYVLKP